MTATLLMVSTAVVVIAGALRRRRPALDRVRLVDARQEALAPTIDLIAMTVGAGGTPADGVMLVAERGPPAVRAAFGGVVERQRRGDVLIDALPLLTEMLGADYHPLVTALAANEHGGAPVGALLQRLSEEAERARSRSVELALARLPVTLLVPLVCCQLPAVVVGAVVPLTIVAFRHLRG